MIPFLDLAAGYRELKTEIDTAVSRVLSSGRYILGPEVESFEKNWADYCGTSHAVGVASGLDALILALRALEVGPGDEVLVPSNTFIATWLAVTAVGATPKAVEPHLEGYNIEASDVRRAIGPRTKAIIPVHLYGHPVDLDPLVEVAREYGIRVVEDAAQAHGAKYKGSRIGGSGDVACWSFYPGKNLGAFGDAGAITTNDESLAERVRLLRNYGSSRKYKNERLGQNSRLDPLQAAVLDVKLTVLDDWIERRRTLAAIYSDRLTSHTVITPKVSEWADHSWHLYVVRTSERERIQHLLEAKGIQSLVHYPIPPHLQPAYRALGIAPESLPVAIELSQQVLSLPLGPHLSSEHVHRVCDVLLGE